MLAKVNSIELILEFHFSHNLIEYFEFYSGGEMMKAKIFRFIGLLFILTFWLTETVESKVYSAGPGINGAENSNNNSGSTTRHNGGSSRYGEAAGRPKLSEPDFDNKGNGHGRSKKPDKSTSIDLLNL
jgi:hypothetical protein